MGCHRYMAAAHVLAALWHPAPWLQQQINAVALAMGWRRAAGDGSGDGSGEGSEWGGVIGMHVRRGDACHCPTAHECHVPEALRADASWRKCATLSDFVDKARALPK